MENIYNFQESTPQIVYDSYNTIVFSPDTRVFNKMMKKVELYSEVKDLNGDILEFGVFKGAGMALFLKLKDMYEPNSLTKVIGFDYFNKDDTTAQLNGLNKDLMTTVLNRNSTNDLSIDKINEKLAIFQKHKYMLIKGDAVVKSIDFDKENPGARIKLLYMDLDVGEPTYNVMKALWKKVVKGGIVVFDEYGYHKWDESNGVDSFLKEVSGEYDLFDCKISSPTAYIRKK